MPGRFRQWLYLGFRIDSILKSSRLFSAEELKLLEDRRFYLLKKGIDEKVESLLHDSQKAIKADSTHFHKLPESIKKGFNSINKGENYKGFPYWVSDYPRDLGSANLFSFRTMVWWGHYISFSILLKGAYISAVHWESLYDKQFHFSTSEDLWDADMESSNFIPIQIANQKIFEKADSFEFIRISQRIKLSELEQLPQLSVLAFDAIMSALELE